MKILGVGLALLVVLGSWPAYSIYQELRKGASEDPLVWESAIASLESATRDIYPPGVPVVFVGSSSIRLWSSLHMDMQPIPIVQHGFGGAKLNDVVHYADRLITAYEPRAVVVFAGTNDIDPRASKKPEVLLASYQSLVAKITAQQPDLPVFFINVTPSPLRWEVWSIAQQTNALIKQYSEQHPNLHVIDTGPALLGADGVPAKDNYRLDGLHLSSKGYAIWTQIIRERLLDELGPF
ncbi:MAG: GDSL-type esterase/lipase family protein [Halioglobus sp.]